MNKLLFFRFIIAKQIPIVGYAYAQIRYKITIKL